jgi:ribosomal protein S18 acetylase RimI-like enzyme
MKRMFVPTKFRRLGIGRALANLAIAEARNEGYKIMRLDTSRRQVEAIQLYEESGFKRIPPYYRLPGDLREYLIFFELDLS